MALSAGDILFKILGDDTGLREALDGAKGHAMRAGQAVGAAMTAAGAAITGIATSSILDFAAMGDEIGKMAARTGFSTERLSELKHAAEQGGASLNDIEKASKRLSTTIYEAGQGTETYQEALAALGLRYQDLATLSPEQQFHAVTMALADVQDHTTKVALANEIFGRSGTQLLPMLANGSAGLREMAEEARRLGIVFSADMTAGAEGMTDEMDEVKKSITGLKMEIAVALLPTVRDLLVWLRDTIAAVTAWTKANPEAAASIVKIGTAVGAAMVVLGPLLVMLPGIVAAFGAVKAIVLAVGAVFTAFSAPVVLAIGAVVAAGVALWAFWDEFKAGIKFVWESVKTSFMTAFGPIYEAIKWLMDVGLGVLQKAASFVGLSSPTLPASALPQVAQNRGGLPSTQNRGGGGEGGGLGGANIVNHFNITSNDPAEVSRSIAATLQMQLATQGVSL